MDALAMKTTFEEPKDVLGIYIICSIHERYIVAVRETSYALIIMYRVSPCT